MIALQNILSQLDELNLQQQPYSDHYALKYDENTRMHYSALFLMALLQEGAIAEQQQRMLESWLPAVGLAGRQVELCEMAARLAKSGLAEAIKLIQKDEQLAHALLLDMMIFSRVAKPLSDSTIQLLEALAGFFKLTERNVADIVYFAAFILGLNVDELERPNADLSLDAYSVYAEFLYDLPISREKRLFAWVKGKGLEYKLPCHSNELTEISELSFEDYEFPLPEELDLLINLEQVTIYTATNTLDNQSLLGLRKVKKIYVYHYGFHRFHTLPDELLNLEGLTEIRFKDIGFDYISDKIKKFIKDNNITIITDDIKTRNLFN